MNKLIFAIIIIICSGAALKAQIVPDTVTTIFFYASGRSVFINVPDTIYQPGYVADNYILHSANKWNVVVKEKEREREYRVFGNVTLTCLTVPLDGKVRFINDALPINVAVGLKFKFAFLEPTLSIAPMKVWDVKGEQDFWNMSSLVMLKLYKRIKVGVWWWMYDSRIGETIKPTNQTTGFVVGLDAFDIFKIKL